MTVKKCFDDCIKNFIDGGKTEADGIAFFKFTAQTLEIWIEPPHS